MKCPECKDKELVSIITKKGVVVDECPNCKGIWLDKGEIYYFTSAPSFLKNEISKALNNPKPTNLISPRGNEPMIRISLFNTVDVEYCLKTGGIWLNKGELEKITRLSEKTLHFAIDKKIEGTSKKGAFPPPLVLPALPSLFLPSVITLGGLYALLGLFLILCVEFLGMDLVLAVIIGIAFAIAHFAFGPYIMDITLKWLFNMSWINFPDLPTHLQNFVENVCKEKNMKLPKFGIIHDGAPQAFTYGHTPNNARIIISQGLINLLEEKELSAVIAHEIGHAKHWDMLIITLAQLVPLILYYIYRIAISSRTKGSSGRRDPTAFIAVSAYILYIISEYLVLWFSRIREYFADRFSGEVTADPNSLASALVKIGYGLAGQKLEYREAKEEKKEERKPAFATSIGALGIFDHKMAHSLAICSFSPAMKTIGEVNKETLKEAMKWDLWNPWAKYYELHSTHPLIAKRLNMLSKQAQFLMQKPYITFDETKPESYWDEFFVDIFIKFLPLIALIFSILFLVITNAHRVNSIGIIILAIGIASIIKLKFSYPRKGFPEFSIAGLLKNVKVSGIRPVPCTVKGEIIGRGVPGLIFSEDFVLQDDTGIIFLDYHQPLKIIEFLFGLLRAGKFINKRVTITGWYRRAPVPYIELNSIEIDGKFKRCYVYYIKLVLAILAIIFGLILLLTPSYVDIIFTF
jgi:heat shock protein HtpX